MEKLYRCFIIEHNRPKSIQTKTKSKQNQSNQTTSKTKPNQDYDFHGTNGTNVPTFSEKMTQKLEQPIQIEKSNYQNYTTWCKQIKTKIGDRGRLNHINAISLSTTNPHWVQMIVW